jgi:putative selenium metabolism hydrolase
MDVKLQRDVLDLAQELVRIPGVSGAEADVADAVERAMTDLGFGDVSRDALGSVVGVVGPGTGKPKLLFDGHMDVVPAAGNWSTNPFKPIVQNGRLYGRGTTDMKAGLAAAICGVAAAGQGGGLRKPVAISATVLEETVEGVALGRILDTVDPEAVVICEPSDLSVQVGQRGRAELVVTVMGSPAHAAYPGRGKNPIELAAQALGALEHLALPVDPELGPAILVPTDVISDPWPSISLIPAAVRVRFDRRTVMGESRDDVVSSLAKELAAVDETAFTVEVVTGELTAYTGHVMEAARWLPPWRTDRENWLVKAASRGIAGTGMTPQVGSYDFCTNGSESAGVRLLPTIGLGPGSPGDAHTVDESISVAQMYDAVRIYERLALEAARSY